MHNLQDQSLWLVFDGGMLCKPDQFIRAKVGFGLVVDCVMLQLLQSHTMMDSWGRRTRTTRHGSWTRSTGVCVWCWPWLRVSQLPCLAAAPKA